MGTKHEENLDSNLCKDLAEAIETLTHTGLKTLDQAVMKKLKNICKRSDKYIEHTYYLLLHQLKKDHAEVRYSTFQICDEIFRRSHCFRELLIADMQLIFELTAETNPDKPLPPPRPTAVSLKRLALKTIQQWHEIYGKGYKKLALGYNYLRQCKKIDFNSLAAADETERSRQEEVDRRLNTIKQERSKKVLKEITEKEDEISNTVTSLKNCINLLLPHPEDFFIIDNESSSMEVDDNKFRCLTDENVSVRKCVDDEEQEEPYEGDAQSSQFREVGIVSSTQMLSVNLNLSSEVCIKETEENSAVIENARELAKLIDTRYLPTVKTWLQILTKATGFNTQIKKIVQIKVKLESILSKYKRLNIQSADTESVSTDSELEEVCEDETSKQSAVYQGKTEGPDHKPGNIENSVDSTINDPQPSTSYSTPEMDRKKKLLSVAPKLPFDIDLYHWEDETMPVPTMVNSSAEGHRFWSASGESIDELPVPEEYASLRTRVIEFTGDFQPVMHTCRTPLPSGKLCPRKDRVKCPFHGLIVLRDESGKCINPEDEQKLAAKAEKEKQEIPDWQDPQLLKEIEAATGIDLKIPEKHKRRKKKESKYPGLTDIKKKQNTATKRLEKKIFKRATVKKIAASLDNLDHRRFRDKFGDQFNYVHDTS